MSFGMMEALLSFFRRQVGLRTDVADLTGSLHAKATANANLITGGVGTIESALDSGVLGKSVIPSDTIRISSDSEASGYTSTQELVKAIQIFVSGIVRVSFDMKVVTSYGICKGQVSVLAPYWDSSGIFQVSSGILRTVSSSQYTTFTEDLYCTSGSKIILYAGAGMEYMYYVRNFRVGFDFSPTPVFGQVVQHDAS